MSDLDEMLFGEKEPTKKPEPKFYRVWIKTLDGKTKNVEIQAESIEGVFAKAITYYRQYDRCLISL